MLVQILLRRLNGYVSLGALEKDGGKTYMVKVQGDSGSNESQGHFLGMPYYVYPADTVLEILKNTYRHMLWNNCLLIFTCVDY